MKDLHCHLLYGIDDGSADIEESVGILKKAANQGITEVMITPHYMENTKYNCNNKTKIELFKNLYKRIAEEKIDLKLYLGNEIYFTENMLELLANKEIMSLNGGKYLLIEFPMHNMIHGTRDYLFRLINKGYIPIIAHPERYRFFQDHPDFIEKYINMGVLFQGNYLSLYGKYGKNAKKLLKFYLKKGYITFLASDIHHLDDDYNTKKLYKDVKKLVKRDEKVLDLLENNFDHVINNRVFNISR